MTTACNRDPIPIGVLEKELVGMWWDEYEYHDVTEDGVPFDRVLLFVGANEDHTGYLYLAAFDNNSDEAVAACRETLKKPTPSSSALTPPLRSPICTGGETTTLTATHVTGSDTNTRT